MPFATRLANPRRALAAALALAAAPALAQTTPAPATPRPAQTRPAAPAQQAPAQQAPAQQPQAGQQPGAGPLVVQVKPEPSQPEWTKVCGKDSSVNAEICYTTRDFVSDQGQPVLAVAVYDIKGAQANQQQKVVRFLMPLGLLVQPGIRFAVDQGQPTPGRYTICFPNGCFAEAQVKDDFIAALKKGGSLNVSVQNQGGREVSFAVPAAGFGKGFDGAPIDPAVLQQKQEELKEQLNRQSDEMRKRLEQQTGAAAAPAPASSPAAAPAPASSPAAAPAAGARPATPAKP